MGCQVTPFTGPGMKDMDGTQRHMEITASTGMVHDADTAVEKEGGEPNERTKGEGCSVKRGQEGGRRMG